MNKKSGEILTIALIGLAIGAVASVINYNSWAQQKANLTGMEIGAGDYMAEEPVAAFGMPIGGALLGAGIGAIVDGMSGGSKGDDSSVKIEAGGDVQFIGRDGEQDQGNKPTTTTTTTTTNPQAKPEPEVLP
jgi:hypothetical protein